MYSQANSNATNTIKHTIPQRKGTFSFLPHITALDLSPYQHGTSPACISGLPSLWHPVKSSITACNCKSKKHSEHVTCSGKIVGGAYHTSMHKMQQSYKVMIIEGL